MTASGLLTHDPAWLGITRSLQPPGALVHIAEVVDPVPEINDYEAELSVEMLAIDATSFAEIRRRSNGDPEQMARTIQEIVSARGKLQNPWTGSGGVAMGRVVKQGRSREAGEMSIGDLVVPLASLIAIPLQLTQVGPVNPRDPLVPVRGRAVVTGGMRCGVMPDDLPTRAALTAFDVYPVAHYASTLASSGDHVLILGGGHAGLLALASAAKAVGATGTVSVVDVSPAALERAAMLAPAANTLQADVTQPLTVVSVLAKAGAGPADLTLICTDVAGAEGSGIVATKSSGTVVFFSTATRFSAAALGADAIGSQAQLVIPNGLTRDLGQYALELLRELQPLQDEFAAPR